MEKQMAKNSQDNLRRRKRIIAGHPSQKLTSYKGVVIKMAQFQFIRENQKASWDLIWKVTKSGKG